MKALTNRNYDNRELGPDEELVLYFINEADIESYINPLSIVRWHVGRVTVKAAWTAFKKGADADIARKQFYYYIRDLNGQFHCKNTVPYVNEKQSNDENDDDDNGDIWKEIKYRKTSRANVEDPAEISARLDNFARILYRLTDEAPQYLAALVFLNEGLTGTDFQKAMHVGHSRAAEIQADLYDLLRRMIELGYDQVALSTRSTKYDAYYREISLSRSKEVMDFLMELYCL